MLDFNTAIEDSFANMHNAPHFASGALAPAGEGATSDMHFIEDMEARFLEYQISIAKWRDGGRAQRAEIESHLRARQVAFTVHHFIRIRLLIDDISERLAQDVEFNSRGLKHMAKMGRKITDISPTGGAFIVKLVGRIRTVAEAEMDELTQAIDWWSGISAKYDPDNKRSQVFDDPNDLIAYLRSA